MLTKRKYGDITWIDIISPEKKDVAQIVQEYRVHPLAAKELLSPTLRPKVDIYEKQLYLILHFPAPFRAHDGKREEEIDFIVGKDFLITAHYKPVKVLTKFAKLIDSGKPLDGKTESSGHEGHVGCFFYEILHEIFTEIIHDLDEIKRELKDIENHIFQGHEHEMVKKISITSRKLLDIRVATRPHREVLESFHDVGKKFFGEDFSYHLSSLVGEHYRVYSFLESSRETLNDLRETNDSLLTTKTNDAMKMITILAFITFPLSLIASIFGMNTTVLPVVGHPNDFWIILGGMFFLTFCFFLLFLYKKWI